MASSPRDTLRELLQRSIEAGKSLPKASREELEALARLVAENSAIGRERLEDVLEEVRAQSRRGLDLVGDYLRTELRREAAQAARERRDEVLEFAGQSVEALGDLLGRLVHEVIGTPEGARSEDESAAEAVRATPEKNARAKQAAVKKAAVKKAAVKKTTVKKTAAKKTAAKKTAAKTVGAKKTAAKKIPSKKAGATRTSAGARRPASPTPRSNRAAGA
jgi:hypothetical protein